MPPVTPCLWFDGNAEEAVDLYLSVFPNSLRHGTAPEDPRQTVMVSFELDGRPFLALNGGPDYSFTPAVSFVISCATQADVDHYWAKLGEGGDPGRCGWLTDRFGVSWQVVPTRLAELMGDPDPARAERTREAMLAMSKLVIAELEAAADGR